MSVTVTFLLFSFLFSSISAFDYFDDPTEEIQKFCTVADKVVIKSMKTGAFLVGGNAGDEVLAQNEDKLTGNQFWAVEGGSTGSGLFVFKNLKTSAILDIEGGCEKVKVITYKAKSVHPNNRFYINPFDHTIGVQCGPNLRLKVNESGELVVANIYDPENSDEDVHFSIERIS